MEKILINWLTHYTGTDVTMNTAFKDLKFDVFDESMTVDFVDRQFQVNVNITEAWFETVKDLLYTIEQNIK